MESETIGTGLGTVRAAGRVARDAAMAAVAAAGAVRRIFRRLGPLPVAERELLGQVPSLLRARGYRESTIVRYSDCTVRYMVWRHARANCEKIHDVPGFLADLTARGQRSAVLRVHLAALRTVLDRLLDQQATSGVRYAARPPCMPPAHPADVRRLLSEASGRDALLVSLAARVGLRPGELSTLKWRQIDTGGSVVQVVRGRRGRTVGLAVPAEVMARLAAHRVSTPEDYVFPGRGGGRPLAVRSIQLALSRLVSRCQVRTTYTRLAAAARLAAVDIDSAGQAPVFSDDTSCRAAPLPARGGAARAPPRLSV